MFVRAGSLSLSQSASRLLLQTRRWLPLLSTRPAVTFPVVMFTDHTHQCPDYLTHSVHSYSNNDPARYRLRSATGTNYSVPRTRTKFGDRAFSVAGPAVWNSLPATVHHADSLHSFKRRLKSHFCSLCFNDWQFNALQVQFRTWRALNSLLLACLLTYLLTCVCEQLAWSCHLTVKQLWVYYHIENIFVAFIVVESVEITAHVISDLVCDSGVWFCWGFCCHDVHNTKCAFYLTSYCHLSIVHIS